MATIIEKIKGNKPLAAGAKVPSHALKEDNPEQGTVNLSELQGTSKHDSCSQWPTLGIQADIRVLSHRYHCRRSRRFHPPCSSQVPEYALNGDTFANKGVKGIYIVAVNDTFTTKAWKEKLGANHPIVHFLADDTGAFTKEAGLLFDASGLLDGHRSQRYVAVVENGVVKHIFVEDEAPSITVTKAENVLGKL